MIKVSVVIPNWNGAERLPACLDSLLTQSLKPKIIVVDNGSSDDSRVLLYGHYPDVEVIPQPTNLGFAAGVNAGIRRAIELGHDYVALLNNDAVADKSWLSQLSGSLAKAPTVGIATSKMLDSNGEYLDSTGEIYTIWGLPYPRGRREADAGQHDQSVNVFGASGGASLYRLSMLAKIGLFDEDFFAYCEDVDLSFRAQLAGWKVIYNPEAKVRHYIGGTSEKIAGFTTYHSIKNLPWLAIKNAPWSLLIRILPRFSLAYLAFIGAALARGQGWWAVKGFVVMISKLHKKLYQRWSIQRQRKISIRYIGSIIETDLPPDARRLRGLRDGWLKLIRRHK